METNPVSETLCSLVSRIPDDGQSPKKAVILTGIGLPPRAGVLENYTSVPFGVIYITNSIGLNMLCS
jgi:hypothetical protein